MLDIQFNQCNNNGNSGIEVEQSSNSDVQQNTTGGSANGISLNNSADNEVTDNTCKFNEYGIYLSEATSNTIMNNSAQLNSEHGIYLTQSDDNELVSNKVWENYDGIVASNASDRNLFQDNTSHDNDEIGIWLKSENVMVAMNTEPELHWRTITVSGSIPLTVTTSDCYIVTILPTIGPRNPS